MQTLFKEISYNLEKLIHDIDMGEIGLPEIQRPFIWEDSKIRNLFDSMYRGYPIGYLLFWANALGSKHKHIGIESKQKFPDLLIVDGQQRLTALFAVIKGVPVIRENYKQELIKIAFKPAEERFEVWDAAIEKSSEYIHNISVLWSPDFDLIQYVNDFIANIKLLRVITRDEEKQISNSITKLVNLRSYPFTALEVSANVNEEQVAEIFVRINSQGKTLNLSDFILTLMSVFWDEGRSDLESFCRSAREPSVGEASPFNFHLKPTPDQLLRVAVGFCFRRARLQNVYNILRGKDLETEEFSSELRDVQFGKLKTAQSQVLDLQNWHEYLKVLINAGFLNQYMISSDMNVLYAYVFFLLGKMVYEVDSHELRSVISKWFFMVSLTGRYTGSAETAMERDFARLRDVNDADGFVSLLKQIIAEQLTDDFWRINLPTALASSSSKSPALFAYYASLNVLGVKVLFSNLQVSDLFRKEIHAKRSALERHHLFPKAYLKKIGITESIKYNQIANFALIEWLDNAEILDKAPEKYFAPLKNKYSSEELQKMYKYHALPLDWESMEYFGFLAKRRQLMALVIKEGFNALR